MLLVPLLLLLHQLCKTLQLQLLLMLLCCHPQREMQQHPQQLPPLHPSRGISLHRPIQVQQGAYQQYWALQQVMLQ